jgi:hypothetical protein
MEREKDTTQSSLDTFKAPGTGDVCVCVCVSVYTHAHTLTRTHIRILLRKQATVIYLSVCYYICVRMLLYLCPYATIFVSVCYYICVLKALRRLLRPKAPGSICVRIQRYMCPHTHVYVLILKRESRQSGYYNWIAWSSRGLVRLWHMLYFAYLKHMNYISKAYELSICLN